MVGSGAGRSPQYEDNRGTHAPLRTTNNKSPVTNNAGAHAPHPPVTNNELPVTSNASSAAGLVVAADRPADIVAFERQVVGFFVDAADLLGVPKSVAAIYGICFASPEPLSFSDIDERLDISSGSISQGLRVLKEVGALKSAAPTAPLMENAEGRMENGVEQQSGVDPAKHSAFYIRHSSLAKRDALRYVPDLELRKLILRWLENRLQNELKSGQSRLKTIMASMPASLDQPDAVLRTRFESLQTWHDKAASLLPIAKTFLKLT